MYTHRSQDWDVYCTPLVPQKDNNLLVFDPHPAMKLVDRSPHYRVDKTFEFFFALLVSSQSSRLDFARNNNQQCVKNDLQSRLTHASTFFLSSLILWCIRTTSAGEYDSNTGASRLGAYAPLLPYTYLRKKSQRRRQTNPTNEKNSKRTRAMARRAF